MYVKYNSLLFPPVINFKEEKWSLEGANTCNQSLQASPPSDLFTCSRIKPEPFMRASHPKPDLFLKRLCLQPYAM